MRKIKDELKETRNQRDTYKKRYEESIKIKESNQVVELLKHSIEKLINEINIKYKILIIVQKQKKY